MAKTIKSKVLHLAVQPDMHRKVWLLAQTKELPVSTIIRHAISAYLSQQEQSQKAQVA